MARGPKATIVNYRGTDMTIGEAISASGSTVNYSTVHARLNAGLSVLDALTRPVDQGKAGKL